MGNNLNIYIMKIYKNLLIMLSIVLSLAAFKTSEKSTQKMENDESTIKATPAYTIHGNGEKKVLVLHSWMDDYESWKPVIPYLDLDAYTYVFIDIRGYGKSKTIKGEYNSNEIANDVFDVADDLGWNNFFLVGHSMTGMAVQKAAAIDKENRIQKVVAITPVSSAGFPVDDTNLQFFKSIPQNKEMTKIAFGTFTSNRLSSIWYDSRTQRNIEAIDREAQLAYINMWTKENFKDQMRSIETPFLVLWGQYDHPGFLEEAQKKAFDGVKNVELMKIENSGHFPMFETPVFLAATIENYFGNQ